MVQGFICGNSMVLSKNNHMVAFRFASVNVKATLSATAPDLVLRRENGASNPFWRN